MNFYDGVKITLIMFQDEDIVTLSGDNEIFGTDLGDGQVGGDDIFE